MENKKIHVIVVTHNGMQWYDRCLGSLRESTYPIDVIVYDNASSDGSADYIEENYPEVILMRSNVNIGFGQGNNKAMRFALDKGANAVILLNQDAWIESDAVAKFIDIHDKNKDYGVLSPINYLSSMESICKGYLSYFFLSHNIDPLIMNDYILGTTSDVYQIKSVCATIWYINSDVLRTVGGFDPLFFHFGEDDNYLQRVNFHGFKIGVCPHIKAVHGDENFVRPASKHREFPLSHNNSLLMKWLDINRKKSMKYYISVIIKQLMKNVLLLRWGKLSLCFYDLKYAINNKNCVDKSRSINRVRQESWL